MNICALAIDWRGHQPSWDRQRFGTSAVDPATEVRVQRALDGLSRGRTSITIAHRVSTAEAADEVIVVDKGRIVERGPHLEVERAGGVYSGLHASWVAQQHGK